MCVYAWRGAERNFGDELNRVLRPRLWPGLFDGYGPDLFLGIGSALDARHARRGRKIVAGAGYGGYEAPAALDGSWDIYWVRGPRTAARLGLPTAFGLGDPASLLPLAHTLAGPRAAGTIGFMPHFESLARGPWKLAAAAAGITLIDPRVDPLAICAAVAGYSTLLSEALHGVIVADALCVPWVALRPVAAIHRVKWHDWAGAMDLELRFQPLAACSPGEWAETTWSWMRPGVRRALVNAAWRFGRDESHLDGAAAALRHAAHTAPQLSPAATLDHVQTRMLTRLQTLPQDCAGLRHLPRRPLRPGGKSAYDTGSVG